MNKVKSFLIMFPILFLLAGCGEQIECKVIDDVKGMTFQIPFSTIVNATAISQITNDMEFDMNTSYLYKDGESQFILFNMSSIVVAAQKGTTFNFSEQEELDLQEGNILGIQFLPYDKKSEYHKKKQEFKGKANAEVVITQNVYENFIGNLRVKKIGNTEWSIFVGVPSKRYENISKKISKMLDSMAESFEVAPTEEEETKDSTENKGEVKNRGKVEPLTVSQNTVEKTEQNRNTVQVSNQKKLKTDTKMVHESSIYQLLELNLWGKVSVFDRKAQDNKEVKVRIEKVFTEKEAENIIKKLLDKEEQIYSEPPEGMKWQVVRYSFDYSEIEEVPYINVSIKGLDGEKLNFQGIKYSCRTYDLFKERKIEDTIVSNNYCFYAVPNGCEEYVLQCSGMSDNPEESCYYHLKERAKP